MLTNGWGHKKRLEILKKKNEEVKQIGNVENGDLWRTKTLNRLEMLKKGDLIKDTDVKQIREKKNRDHLYETLKKWTNDTSL